jgi:hypothetical protein
MTKQGQQRANQARKKNKKAKQQQKVMSNKTEHIWGE